MTNQTARYTGPERSNARLHAVDVLRTDDIVTLVRVPDGEFFDGHEVALVQLPQQQTWWVVRLADLTDWYTEPV